MADPEKRAIAKKKSPLAIILALLALALLLGSLLWKFALTPKEPAVSSATSCIV